ncbi:MAG: hypothetical protein KDD70_01550 [Bdellovibrionales bacterium]|nr:hypothetical protein [Bdellovibrionales bacterium]
MVTGGEFFVGASGSLVLNSEVNAPRPLKLSLRRAALPTETRTGLSVDSLDPLLDAASGVLPRRQWKQHGIFARGRSLIMILPKEQRFVRHGIEIEALRIKGVTDHGAAPKLKDYKRSRHTIFKPPIEEFSIQERKLHSEKAAPDPRGYCYLEDSTVEYQVTRHASRLGLPVSYPVGLGAFTEHRYKDRPLGFMVLGISASDDLRLHRIKGGRRGAELFVEAGMALRSLHENGIAHWNPHHGNFFIGRDERVGVCDLEESKIFGVHTLDSEEFAVYRMRDLFGFGRNAIAYCARYWRTPVSDRLGTAFLRAAVGRGLLGLQEGKPLESITLKSFQDVAKNFWDELRARDASVEEVVGQAKRIPFLRGLFSEIPCGLNPKNFSSSFNF